MTGSELQRMAEVRRRLKDGEAREVRRAAGVSLSEMACAVGVSPTAIWRYENGSRVPRTAAALAYARALERLEQGLSK